MTDHDDQHDIWVYLWRNDRHHPLTRFCIIVSIAAFILWFLIQLLIP